MKNKFEINFKKNKLVQYVETRAEAKAVLMACYILNEEASALENTEADQKAIGHAMPISGGWAMHFIEKNERCQCPSDIVRGKKYILCCCGGKS